MEKAKTYGFRRRDVIKLGAALSLTPFLKVPASAESSTLVLVNWGGENSRAMDVAFAKPYELATGNKVLLDSSGPSAGKIRAMAQSGKVTWDVCDATVAASMELGEAGFLEEIDYSIVDPALTLPEFAYKWGVGSYVYSSIIAYDTAQLGDKAPGNWADFWNVKEFPGRRLLRADLPAMLESALMSDGVDPAKLYPLDVERGFEKIREIKEHCLFWKTAAESAQLLRTGEVVMANMWNTRASPLIRQTEGRIALTWNQGILQPAVWVVPKGNPAGREAAMKFVSFMLQPDAEIEFARIVLSGPGNPQAAARLPEDIAPLIPTAPQNISKQIPMNAEWYAENYSSILPKYLNLIAG